jgi:hypothetical protein
MGSNRKYKDSVFSLLFSDPDLLRELYGAIEDVKLPPDIPITINTLEGVLYMTLLNDLSFAIADKLVILIEHQSTINPNMALRLLMYIARVYEKITAGRVIFGRKRLSIPRPEFIVLYNGTAPYPDEAVLKLSEAFEGAGFLGLPGGAPQLELVVKVYNINEGHNEGIAGRCRVLKEYRTFIGKAREYGAEGTGGKGELSEGEREEAIRDAVRWCIEHDILKEFLRKHGAEVTNMLMTEWKLDEVLAVRERDAREEGLEEGLERGLEQGLERGLEQGLEQGREEAVKNLLKYGMSPGKVAEALKIPLETVMKIQGS